MAEQDSLYVSLRGLPKEQNGSRQAVSNSRLEIIGRPTIPAGAQAAIVLTTLGVMVFLSYLMCFSGILEPVDRTDLAFLGANWSLYLLLLALLVQIGRFRTSLIADEAGITYRTDLFPVRPRNIEWSKIARISLDREILLNRIQPLLIVSLIEGSERVLKLRGAPLGLVGLEQRLREVVPSAVEILSIERTS